MDTLSAITLNVGSPQRQWLRRRHLLITELLDLKPDLIALQQLNLTAGQGWWLARQLNARLGQTHYQIFMQRRRHWWQGNFEGVAILSRLPVVTTDVLDLGFGGYVALRANVEVVTGHTIDFVCTYFRPARRLAEVREQQAMRLFSWLSEPGQALYQMIAGDLNEVPSGLAVRYLKQRYVSAYEQAHGREPLATWPTTTREPWPEWAGCLDYLLVSPNIVVDTAVLCFRTPDSRDTTLYPSDHVGLYTRFRLR
ncbi:MAG: endonuclease/exonuclease/phosphatase family protein [Anaerolineales bacterium]|nr:endonuclease/exonuclease/phosphatase family protein [Anaerolineales bacterium]